MSEQSSEEYFKDHLVVKHPDGEAEKVTLPEDGSAVFKVGRELDNDIVLTDPRASRHHAEIRQAGAVLEVKDLGSANGVLLNGTKIEANTWVKITPKQELQLAETKIVWEKSASTQSTVVMRRQKRDDTIASPVPSAAAVPPHSTAGQQKQATSTMPWLIGAGVIVVLLILLGLVMFFAFRGGSGEEAAAVTPTAAVATTGSERGTEGGVGQQSTSLEPTKTPTPSGPQLAIPVVDLTKFQVSPVIFGASPNTTNAYLFINVRVRNAGNVPFIFSISNFSLRDKLSGQTFTEAGANTSELYLKQLGAIDRFSDLALTPGGSVPGSLVFDVEIDTYDLELVFDAPDVEYPVVIGLGTTNMRRELDLAAGTPLAELDSDAAVEATTTPTAEPTPTPTRPAAIPAPQVVSRSALEGTIAFPSFNGETFDIYIGDVASSETRFFQSQASQPAFSPDGSRVAYHSWDNSNRGLVARDVSGANGNLIATFIEDQLPVWTADGGEIVFLSRRSGDRKSNLIKVDGNSERSDGTILGEGEYPSIGTNGQLVFKGWGNTAFGLRQSDSNMQDVETVTNVDVDTAPSLSPDGSRVAFMSRREGENWDIYVSNVDGSGLQRLTQDDAQDGLPVWSPDGNAIAFVSDRGGIWAVWVMTPDGKGISQLFTIPGSPDGFVGNDNYASRGWAEERISWTAEKLIQ